MLYITINYCKLKTNLNLVLNKFNKSKFNIVLTAQ